MNNDDKIAAVCASAFVALAVSAVTIIAQRARIQELEDTIHIKERSTQYWRKNFRRAINTLSGEQLRSFGRAVLDDLKFEEITKDF